MKWTCFLTVLGWANTKKGNLSTNIAKHEEGCSHCRRKFRSQTPTKWTDEKQRWEESEKRREEKNKEDQRRESQKKEDPGARKGRKVAKYYFFPMICGSGGSKGRLAKAAGAEPSGQMRDDKLHAVVARSTSGSQIVQSTSAPEHFWKLRCRTKCTPLWCEAHFQVKMYKRPQLRSTFGSWDVEKAHAIVARSTFPSQNLQNISVSDHFWRWTCQQSGRRCGTKHISKSKVQTTEGYGALSDVQMSFCVAGARDCAPGQKVSKMWGFFAACSKTMAGVGHLKRMCKDAFRVAGAVQETRSSEMFGVRRSGRWFPERGCILEHQIFRFPKMILRDRCSTSYDLASLFRGRHNTLDRWNGKIAKRIGGRQLCTQLFILEGGLAELLRFWCCQLRKRRKSRRIASFLTLSSSRIEEISQNCCVFKLADRQVDR